MRFLTVWWQISVITCQMIILSNKTKRSVMCNFFVCRIPITNTAREENYSHVTKRYVVWSGLS